MSARESLLRLCIPIRKASLSRRKVASTDRVLTNWVENGRPEHLKAACEGSLRRLRCDRIDLYQLHRIDPKVPMERQLGALKDLQAGGKIKHIGLSEVSVRELHDARTIVSIAGV